MLAVEPVAPSVAELLGHVVHAAAPVSALKESAAHAVGVPPSGPVNPAEAKQSVMAVELVPLVPELPGHSVHTASPVLVLKVPAAQAEGVLPSAPVYPAAAIQATLVVEPTGLLALGGQAVNGPPFGPVNPAAATQSVLAVEPVPVVPELLGHAEHAAAPVAALKEAAAHAVKLPPFGPV